MKAYLVAVLDGWRFTAQVSRSAQHVSAAPEYLLQTEREMSGMCGLRIDPFVESNPQ